MAGEEVWLAVGAIHHAAFQRVCRLAVLGVKFKHAIVLPLLKKNGLNKDQLKNYRLAPNHEPDESRCRRL